MASWGALSGGGLELIGRVLLLLGVNGSVAWLAYEVARRVAVAGAYGGFAIPAIVIGLAVVHLGGLMLGLAGMLGFPGLVTVAVAAAAVAALIRRRGPGREGPAREGKDDAHAAIAWAMGICLWVFTAWRGFRELQGNVDSLEYHLPMVLDWLATGRFSLSELAAWQAFYPANFELTILWLLAPLRADAAVHLVNILFAVLLALSAASLAARLGLGSRGRSLVIACAVATPITVANITSAQVDLGFAALYLAAWDLGLAYTAGGPWAALALSAIGLGLFTGMKFSGVGYAPILIVVTWFLARRGRNLRWSSAPAFLGTYLAGMLAFGGYWYLRNLAVTGNPLYPVQVQVGGHVVLPGSIESSWFQATSLAASRLDLPGLKILLWKIGVALGPLASLVVLGLLLFPVLVAGDRLGSKARYSAGDRLLAVLVACTFLLNVQTPFSRAAANWKVEDGFGITTFVEQSFRYGQIYIVGSYLAAARVLENTRRGIGFGFALAVGAMLQAVYVGWWLAVASGAALGLPAILQTYAEIGASVAVAVAVVAVLSLLGPSTGRLAVRRLGRPLAPLIAAGLVLIGAGSAWGVRVRERFWSEFYGRHPRAWFPDEVALGWVRENVTPADALAVIGFARPSPYSLMGPRFQVRVVSAVDTMQDLERLPDPGVERRAGGRPTVLVIHRTSVTPEEMGPVLRNGRWELTLETATVRIYRRGQRG